MADEDVFRRAFEVGTAFFALTQRRAESMLKDLADSGETARDQAQKVVDDAVERGRQRTSELVDLIRSEIRDQVSALGLATRDDVARIEAKLDSLARGGPAGEPATGPAVGTEPGVEPGVGEATPGEGEATAGEAVGDSSRTESPGAPTAGSGGARRGSTGAGPGDGPSSGRD